MNGGSPPVKFTHFNQVITALGEPERPVDAIDLSAVKFGNVSHEFGITLGLFEQFPTPQDFDIYPDNKTVNRAYHGGTYQTCY